MDAPVRLRRACPLRGSLMPEMPRTPVKAASFSSSPVYGSIGLSASSSGNSRRSMPEGPMYASGSRAMYSPMFSGWITPRSRGTMRNCSW
ncbi:MAG: hypothetical protein NT080_10910 [Spirochaetes bacterium]|nr:hypothetical protein [Spirochaetota bacterium]